MNPVNNNNRANGFPVRPSILLCDMKHYTLDELYYLLTYSYLDARKFERNKETQLRFEVQQEKNIEQLAVELYNRTYRPQPPICFLIKYPTYREVFAPLFRDRVVSHLLFNLISPIFEKTFIYDSYSCREGKGTDFGVHRMEKFLRSCSDNYKQLDKTYSLYIDISGYFMSIHRPTLRNIILNTLEKYRIKERSPGESPWGESIDYDLCKFLIDCLLLRDPKKGCLVIDKDSSDWDKLPKNKSLFYAPPETGLPIGDITSQLFSNIYLNKLDHFIKRELGCTYYGRYVDDARILSRDYDMLVKIIPKINLFLREELKLSLHPKKTVIHKCSYGLEFLGKVIRPYRCYVKTKVLRSFTKVVYDLVRSKRISETDLSRLNSYLGCFRSTKEYNNIQKIISKSGLGEKVRISEKLLAIRT